MIGILCLMPLEVWGQKNQPILPALWPNLSVSNTEKQLDRFLHQAYSGEKLTVEHIQEQLFLTGKTDACQLSAILQNTSYLSELTDQQAEEFALSFAYAEGCGNHLTDVLFSLMDKTAISNQKMLALYAMVAVSLGNNVYYWKTVQQWAFPHVEKEALQ